MPGIGTRVAARMLAEASQPLVDRAYHVLRACMGVAPVTKQSGKRRHRLDALWLQWRLRNAAYHWARTGAQKDPASRTYYAALRARGHSHGRALRSVADRLLRILMTLLSRGQIFDPTMVTSHRCPSQAGLDRGGEIRPRGTVEMTVTGH